VRVRELHNALEGAAIVCDGNLIEAEDLGLTSGAAASCGPATVPASNLTVVERETIARVLQETHWNKSRAATRLGLSRTQLDTRMRKHGLVPASLRLSWSFIVRSADDQYQSLMDFGRRVAHSLPATRVKGGSQRD